MKKVILLILPLFFVLIHPSFAQFETKKVRFKTIRGYLFHNPLKVGEVNFHTRIKVGFGLPQGVIGINGEFGLDRIALTVGLGYAKFRDVSGVLGFHAGLR